MLKDSDLLDFYWSLDSNYLLGKGSSSVRVWTTNGKPNLKDFSKSGQLTTIELKPNWQGVCPALQPASHFADETKLSTTAMQVALPSLKIVNSTQRSVPVSQQIGFCL